MASKNKDLLSQLKAVGTNDCENYDLLFNDIAKELLTNYVIKKGSKEYAIIEVEFYFFSKDHPDVITYPRRVDAGQWFFHQSGVDITFQSDEDQFGGILIRGIKDLSDGYLHLGPKKCIDILWDNFNAFNPTVEEFPRLKYKDKVSTDEIHRYRRWIPIIDSERKKKISIWTDRIEHNFSPHPNISPEKIEELVFDSYYRFSTFPLEIIKWGYAARPKASDKYTNSSHKSLFNMSLPISTAIIREGKEIVYLSTLLALCYAETCKRLTDILNKHHIPFAFLEGTKDIWCRDYMPVQTPSGKFIQFEYDPSYLRDPLYFDSRTNVKHVDEINNINPIFSDINLDGGNVVMFGNKAIITDRVFSENPEKSRNELRSKLAELLECQIIIIPAIAKSYDFTGHADGMIRFVDANTVIGNDLSKDCKTFQNKMKRAMRLANLNYIEFPYFTYEIKDKPDNAIGVYLNFLEVGNLIVMPIFGVPGNKDAEALAKLKEVFPNKVIETINYNDVAFEGGILNCTTWVVRK